ncbi:MAG TPA: GNAT family N-acetyltransferase [Chroococcales cyanobacterium]
MLQNRGLKLTRLQNAVFGKLVLDMNSQLEFGTISKEREAQRLGEILGQCFNPQLSDYWKYYSNSIGLENFRVIRDATEVIGGLAILQMGQWIAGQRIPMAGIAAVGVLPEHRGTGVAIELMSQTLKELYAQGVLLSTLYPATQRLYRKAGYEQAGTCCHWKLPIESIQLSDRTLPIQAVPPQPEFFHNLYQQWAVNNSGNVDRSSAMWEFLLQPPHEKVYAYLIGSPTQPEGYIIFNQSPNQEPGTGDYNMFVRDWVALTAAAARRLWTFIADHRSQANSVLWRGPALDPFLLLLPEQTGKIGLLQRWLLRVVDVEKALSRRGYPEGVNAELHLDIKDELLSENNGQFVLRVSQGRGEVRRGGKGELQLDIRALAPLYTGLFTPHQLQLAGQIQTSEAALAIATKLFASSEPWMSDRF